VSRPALEVADIFRNHGVAWRCANAGHVSLDQLKVMTAIERCRTAALGGHVERCEKCAHTVIAYNSCLMGKFRNGELATWVGGNLTVFGALPRYSIFCLLPITTVAPEIAALRDCVLGDWGIRNVSLKSWAHGITETCMAAVPKPMRPFCTASAQRTLQPSRQAERPAQGGCRNGERKLSKSTLNPMRSCPNSPLLNLPIRQVMGVAHYLS
jgi:hypothetical protein